MPPKGGSLQARVLIVSPSPQELLHWDQLLQFSHSPAMTAILYELLIKKLSKDQNNYKTSQAIRIVEQDNLEWLFATWHHIFYPQSPDRACLCRIPRT